MGLVVECHSTETVTFQLNGFRHADKLWSVQGTPQPSQPEVNASWTIDQVAGIMTAAVEVTMTASAEGETPKKQKIFIKTKSRMDLPDPQMIAMFRSNPKRWDVYLSYAEPDREIAEHLAARLLVRGVDVFFDPWEIGPGMIVERQREQGMRNSLVSVLLVSRAWSPRVFEEFFALLESAVAGDRLLVPVLLDDTPPPAKLAIRRAVDLRGGESAYTAGVAALVGAVRRARESSSDSGR